LGAVIPPQTSYSFSQWYWIMKEGDVGADVTELQSRLHFLGFYGGTVDGVFGPGTRRAVIGFQREFGMPADGSVGPDTKAMLARATRDWRPTYSAGTPTKTLPTSSRFSVNDITLLARTVHGEARGEPYIGQVAVAAVVLNRIDNPAFPNTIAGVVFQPRAFTAVDDGQIWLEPDASSFQAVQDALNGWDPSSGAIYYFNPVTATSKWIWSRPQIKQIGKHIFCR
jgi:N-acetylmuramoyl-L-alanine amidase